MKRFEQNRSDKRVVLCLRPIPFVLLPKLSERGNEIVSALYACAPFLARLADVEEALLLRVKSNRVFYRPAPARLPGQLGASRKDGDRFQCKDESSHGEPDETWEGLDAKEARLEVRCWNHLHLRTARWVEVSVIQIIRHGESREGT